MDKDKLFDRLQNDLTNIADADRFFPEGGWEEENDNISEDEEGITLNGDDLRLLIRAAIEAHGVSINTLSKLAKVDSGYVSRFLKGGHGDCISVASARSLTAAIQRLNARNGLLELRPETVKRLRAVVGAVVFDCNVSEVIERAVGLFFAALGECPDMLPGYDPRKDPYNKKAWDKKVKGRTVADEIKQRQQAAREEIERLEQLLQAKKEKENQIHAVNQRIETQVRKAQDRIITLKYTQESEKIAEEEKKELKEDGANPGKTERGIRTQRGEYCLIRDKMKYIKRGRRAIYLPPLSDFEKGNG